MGVTQSRMKIYGQNFSKFNSKINVTEFHVGGLWRFNRVIGTGLDIGIPMLQKSTYTLRNSYSTNPAANELDEFFTTYTQERYQPQTFDYTFKQSLKVGIIARVFIGGTSNVFADLKLTYVKLQEDFDFVRAGVAGFDDGNPNSFRPEIKQLDIHENHQHSKFVPGLAIGWQPHVSDRFYLNFNIACDFYKFNRKSFSYVIPYNFYGDFEKKVEDKVTITGQLVNNKRAFTANVRFGMYF